MLRYNFGSLIKNVNIWLVLHIISKLQLIFVTLYLATFNVDNVRIFYAYFHWRLKCNKYSNFGPYLRTISNTRLNTITKKFAEFSLTTILGLINVVPTREEDYYSIYTNNRFRVKMAGVDPPSDWLIARMELSNWTIFSLLDREFAAQIRLACVFG